MFAKQARMLFVMISATALSSPAFAQDQCRDILSDALVNQSTRLSTSQSAEADRLHYCSATLDEAKSYYLKQTSTSSSSGGSAGVGWGPFSASGDTSQAQVQADALTTDDYNLWKSESCSMEERSREASAMEYSAQRSVAESAVAAWRDCMVNREGLSCWVEPHGEEDAMLAVNWRRLSTSSGDIVNSYISGGKAIWRDKRDDEILPPSYKLGPGKLSVFIDREGTESVSMLLNIVHDGSAHTCSALLPKVPEPSPVVVAEPEISNRIFIAQTYCTTLECLDPEWYMRPEFNVDPDPIRPDEPWMGSEVIFEPAYIPLINPELSLQTESAETAQSYNIFSTTPVTE